MLPRSDVSLGFTMVIATLFQSISVSSCHERLLMMDYMLNLSSKNIIGMKNFQWHFALAQYSPDLIHLYITFTIFANLQTTNIGIYWIFFFKWN